MIHQVFLVLFGAIFTVAVCVALGKLFLRGLSLGFHREEEHLFAFVTGAACLSALVFALAAAGLARPGIFLAAGLAAAAWAVRQGMHRRAGAPAPLWPRFWKALFFVVFGAYALLYLFHAVAPEASPDGSSHHLGLVARYLRERGFHRITTDMYASFSQGLEMLFLFAFAFGRHSAAAMVHFAFLLALPWSMVLYARRFGFAPGGVCGALLVFASPVVGVVGTSAYNDVAVACILFTVFYLLQIWDAERNPALLIPVGLVAGFGYAVKYTAFLAVPYALGFVGWKLLRARRPLPRPLASVALAAFVMMAPWMAKNLLWVSNPFSPFFNRLFPNPYVRISFEKDYIENMRNFGGLESRRQIPWEATMLGGKLGGLLGPVFLLAPIGLLSLRRPMGRRLLLAAVLLGLPYLTNIGTRFLIPSLPFFALAMGLALAGSRVAGPALLLVHAALSWPGVVGRYCDPYAWRLHGMPVRPALRLASEEAYIRSKLPPYDVARMVDNLVPPGSKVFTFTGIPQAYTSRDVLVAYQSAFNNRVSDILLAPIDAPPTSYLYFSFPAQALRRVRVVQTGNATSDSWTVTELWVMYGRRQIPRSPRWRVRAHPNPWGVQEAFDNSPATAWRSGEALFGGMYLEVNFDGSETADGVVLVLLPGGLHNIRLRVEGQSESGSWKTLAEDPERVDRAAPRGLRAAAVDEVRSLGVGYLLVSDSDYGAEDFFKNAAAWGITQLGEASGVRLYRLNGSQQPAVDGERIGGRP